MNSILNIDNVSFSYNYHKVLEDVSFTVEEGDFIGVVGENGSGKSTLIKIILGLLALQKGELNFSKELVENQIGYVPQNISISNSIFPITVEEVVSLGINDKEIKTNEKDKRIESILKDFDIQHLKKRMLSELSGGQLQKVFLAKALIGNPCLLILDEPSSALDSEARLEFYKYLLDLNKEKNTTIMIITHDMATVGKYVNKLLYLDKKIVFYGKLKEFCLSEEMSKKIGIDAQHSICHQHHEKKK